MIKVLTILEVLCSKHTSYYYHIRNHFRLHNELYNIDLFLSPDERIVISATSYEDIVEVWTTNHPSEEDGVRVPVDVLLEYLLYIIKAEFDK